ncbi:MAG: hypothetical protein G8D28_07765 [gamma proteobacterium symbiont of Phacoides pectinatus]
MSRSKYFNIKIDNTLTLREIIALGGSNCITRTPHIGNLNPVELMLMSVGVPLRLVDKTCSTIDSMFQPECKIMDLVAKMLSEQKNTLVPYLGDTSDHALTKVHLDAIREAVLEGCATAYSEDYLKDIDRLLPVLDVMSQIAPELFNRFVAEKGRILHQTGFDDSYVYYGACPSERVRIKRCTLSERVVDYFRGVEAVLASSMLAAE